MTDDPYRDGAAVPPPAPGDWSRGPNTLPGGLDCSDAAQALRRKWLLDLQARYYGGVTQVVDRNRSVTYQTPTQLYNAIAGLVGQIAACEAGGWPRKHARVYYVPQVKDL